MANTFDPKAAAENGPREFDQIARENKRRDAVKWGAAIAAKRALVEHVPGKYEPDPGQLRFEGIGSFVTEAKDTYVEVAASNNPGERQSFGFVGAFVEVRAKSSYVPGTLLVRVDPRRLGTVAVETLRVFRWSEEEKGYRLVCRSGVTKRGVVAWARITKPGIYAVIGLNTHPVVLRAIEIFQSLDTLTDAIDPGIGEKLHNMVAEALLAPSQLKDIMSRGDAFRSLLDGVLADGLPLPVAHRPIIEITPKTDAPIGKTPGDFPIPTPNLDDPLQICPPWRQRYWPEWQIIPRFDWNRTFCRDSGWHDVGPVDLAGCVLHMVVDPTNTDRVYACTSDGGVWVLGSVAAYPSTTWRPLTDQNDTLITNAFALAASSPNIMYLADARNYLLRSDDSGGSWRITSTRNLGAVRKIIVHPTEPDLVFVASDSGLWRTRNGGVDWDTNTGTTAFYDGDVTDIAMDPQYSSILFMGVRNVGVLRSWTSGRRWDVVLPWSRATAPGGSMIKVAVGGRGTPDTRTVLARLDQETFINRAGGRGPELGGSAWTTLGLMGGTGYGDWCHVVAVDPFNDNVLFTGAQKLFRSPDGGMNWSIVIDDYAPHEDQHAIAFDPVHPGVVYAGNDGGAFRSTDGGVNWNTPANNLNNGLVTAQFYAVGVAGDHAVGNLYHSGIIGTSALSSHSWQGIEGHAWEFADVHGDPKRSTYFYVFGGTLCRRRYPGTGTGDFIIPFGNFKATSIAVDMRTGSNTLLAGTDTGQVMRALDGDRSAPTWAAVTGVSTPGDSIVTIAFASATSGKAYAVSASGRVFVTSDANGTAAWTERTRLLSGVSQVAVNPLHDDRVYVASGNTVVKSLDGGGTWVPASGSPGASIPTSTVHSLIAHPTDGETLFLGADIGVFISPNEGATWRAFDAQLPNARVLELFWASDYLYAVTNGRGLWRRRLCI